MLTRYAMLLIIRNATRLNLLFAELWSIFLETEDYLGLGSTILLGLSSPIPWFSNFVSAFFGGRQQYNPQDCATAGADQVF